VIDDLKLALKAVVVAVLIMMTYKK